MPLQARKHGVARATLAPPEECVPSRSSALYQIALEVAVEVDGAATVLDTWCEERGLPPAAIAEELVSVVARPRLFLAELARHARDIGAGPEELAAAGLKAWWAYGMADIPFVVLPYWDLGEELLALEARSLRAFDNRPASIMAGSPGPFGLRGLRARDRVVWCEGALDALAWLAAGVPALGLPAGAWQAWWGGLVPPGVAALIAAGEEERARLWAGELAVGGRAVRFVDYAAAEASGGGAAGVLLAGGPGALLELAELATPEWAPGGELAAELEESDLPIWTGRGEGGGGAPPAPPPARGEQLWELIEDIHWVESADGDGRKRVPMVRPPHRLTDACIEWFEDRDGVFVRAEDGCAWLYFGRHLYRLGLLDDEWRGALYDLGRVNLQDREGRLVASALEQYALARRDGPPLRPWCYCDRDRGVLAIHLHHDAQIALVRAGRFEVVENGRAAGMILHCDEGGVAPLRIDPATADPAEALELLDECLVQYLATTPHERSLWVSWVISTWFRHLLGTRALLVGLGPAGSGKSEAAKLTTALIYGSERLIHPTVAALEEEGTRQPFVALDNLETRQIAQNERLQQWLLLAATGAVRKKRLMGTPRGILDQKTDACVLITAIEPPGLDELIQRTVAVGFRHEMQREGYQPGKVLRQLLRARDRIIGGLLRLCADRIMPAFDQVEAYRRQVGPGHPKRRLGQHLALCALIADCCQAVNPGLWGPGREELAAWLDHLAAGSSDQARDSDPIVAALGTLLHSFNRTVERGRDGLSDEHRPALDGAWYRCKPVYRRLEDGELVLEAEKAGHVLLDAHGFAVVVGLVGSYEHLHHDLVRAELEERTPGQYRGRIPTSAVLTARWRHNRAIEDAGWRVSDWRKHARPRLYLFVREDLDGAPGEAGDPPPSGEGGGVGWGVSL